MEDLDELREQSVRTAASYDDIEGFEESNGGFLSQFSPGQRLILAFLLLLNIVVIGYVLLAIVGVV